MQCPQCESTNHKVTDSRPSRTDEGEPCIHRRRQCGQCGYRWSTWECYEQANSELAFKAQDARNLLREAAKKLA